MVIDSRELSIPQSMVWLLDVCIILYIKYVLLVKLIKWGELGGYTLYNVQQYNSTMYNSTMYNITMYNITMFSVQCTVYNVHCTVYNVHNTAVLSQ